MNGEEQILMWRIQDSIHHIERTFQAFVFQQAGGGTPQPSSTPTSTQSNEPKLSEVTTMYLEHIRFRAEAGQVGWSYYRSIRGHLARVRQAFGGDPDFRTIEQKELEKAILWFASRPTRMPSPFHRRTLPIPISVVTAKGRIAAMKGFFVWASEQARLGWSLPSGFNRLFRVKGARMKTPQELAAGRTSVVSKEVATLSIDQLSRLFRFGTGLDRLFILLGLNCGFTSGEIGSLHTFEVFLGVSEPYIHRFRAKSGVEARWVLWPETAALLQAHRAPDNPNLLWFLTSRGNPMVTVLATSRRDRIAGDWSRLWNRSGTPGYLGFRFLRKTGADAVKRLGTLEDSEMYLAHQEPGLNKNYANRNWRRMWDCLVRFRHDLSFLGPGAEIDPGECLFTPARR